MLLKKQVDTNLPFVIYKKPASGRLYIFQQTDNKRYTSPDLDIAGFYFVPFNNDKHPSVVFPENKLSKQSFFITQLELNKTKATKLPAVDTNNDDFKVHFEKVKKALELIDNETLQKIIISRSVKVPFNNFDIFEALLKLMKKYENSYVYLWHHPKVGTWLGASPELLLKYKNSSLQTMALAGTQVVSKNQPAVWQTKEINEQQIVTDYIVKQISKFTSNINISKPKTVFQGQLAHIKTDITANLDKNYLNEIIKTLHPTPAVCGLPMPIANNFIQSIEQYDRAYYTGFLGYKTNSETELFVNLRCMSVYNDFVKLYVGGGIIEGSKPKIEWEEIQSKAKVLLSVLS